MFAYFGTDEKHTCEEFGTADLEKILHHRPIELANCIVDHGFMAMHGYNLTPANVYRRRDVSQTHSIYQEEIAKYAQEQADIKRVRELAREIDNCNSFPMFVTASENVVHSATHMASTLGSAGYYAVPDGLTGPNGWNIHPFQCFEYHKS